MDKISSVLEAYKFEKIFINWSVFSGTRCERGLSLPKFRSRDYRCEADFSTSKTQPQPLPSNPQVRDLIPPFAAS